MPPEVLGDLAREPAADPEEERELKEPLQNRMLRYSSTCSMPIDS